MRLAPQRVIAGKGKPAAQGDNPELGLSVRSRGSCGSQRNPDSSRQRLSPHRDPAGPARGEPAPFSAPKHGGVTAPAESFPSLHTSGRRDFALCCPQLFLYVSGKRLLLLKSVRGRMKARVASAEMLLSRNRLVGSLDAVKTLLGNFVWWW